MDASDAPRRRRAPNTPQNHHHLDIASGDVSLTTKRRKNRRRPEDDEPFFLLVLRVACVLALLCVSFYLGYRFFFGVSTTTLKDDDLDDGFSTSEQHRNPLTVQAEKQFLDQSIKTATTPPTIPPLPIFELHQQANYDVYALAPQQHEASSSHEQFWHAADGLRQDFAQRYGGENAARAILERGLTTFSDENNNTLRIPFDVTVTACRLQQARTEHRPFRMAFGGYSVAAGRGNRFSQSYPKVLEKILHTVFYLLNIELLVENAAIGGCPSFPYGWCMHNFWGTEPDVVSWDYSMNEAGGDPEGIEAYLRHVLQLKRRPKLIVKDTHMALERQTLLQHYSTMLGDAVVIHTDPAAEPFLKLVEDYRPDGFQEWRKFGAPLGAPGQAPHHPAVKEHEFIAWILAMHFLNALQLVAAQDSNLQCPEWLSPTTAVTTTTSLPRPMAPMATNSTTQTPWLSLLYGEPQSDRTSWRLNPIHCRTTFEPRQSGNLAELVVSGIAAEDLDVMLPKSNMYYNRGWVLDLSDGEKKAKHQLDRYGGLGFVDSKKAYYGIVTSGALQLLIPYVSPTNSSTAALPQVGDSASKWFKSLVFCEVNEKRDFGSCIMERDVEFRLGEIVNATTIDAAGTQFLGKKLCVYVPVPPSARITSRDQIMKNVTQARHLLFPEDYDSKRPNENGLAVELQVTNPHIVRSQFACSLSHVVWEQHPPAVV